MPASERWREWREHWHLALAACAGLSLATVLTSTFGVMLEPMQQELGWSRTELTTGPALIAISGLFLSTPAGYLIDRWGSRRCGIMVVLVTCGAIAGMSLVSGSMWTWWAPWSAFALTAAFTANVWLAPISAAFTASRGLAIAVTYSGAGISGALAPMIAEYIVQNHGWRLAFVALSVIWLGITLPLVLAFIPRRQEQHRTDAAGEPADRDSAFDGPSPREGFVSPAFFILTAIALIGMAASIAVMLNLVPILTSGGLSRTEAVAIASTFGVISVVGRLLAGYLVDRFEVRRLAAVSMIVGLALPIALLIAPWAFWAAMIGTACFGLTTSVKVNAIVYLTRVHFGVRRFGLFFGAISTAFSVAVGGGPLLANYVFDRTQSYAPVLWTMIPVYVLVALLFLSLRREPPAWGAKPHAL